jgi:hypothetical protein
MTCADFFGSVISAAGKRSDFYFGKFYNSTRDSTHPPYFDSSRYRQPINHIHRPPRRTLHPGISAQTIAARKWLLADRIHLVDPKTAWVAGADDDKRGAA